MKTIIISLLLMACLSFLGCKEQEQQQATSPAPQTEYIHVGPNWNAVYTINEPDNKVDISVKSKEKLKVGEQMTFSVKAQKGGRLWVLQVDPDDNVTTLFPNKLDKNNAIKANQAFTLPPDGANWSIAASKPTGKSVVAFIVTTGDADLSDAMASKNMKKSLQIVEQAPAWGIAKVVIDVTE